MTISYTYRPISAAARGAMLGLYLGGRSAALRAAERARMSDWEAEGGALPENIHHEEQHMSTEYVATMEAQLVKWDADVAELGAERDRLGIDARTPYHVGMMDLRARRDAAERAFAKMRGTGESPGGLPRAEMDAAWDAMQRTFLRVTTELRK